MVQTLEDRTVPSTFWVSNTKDAGAGSLRQAILDANSYLGADHVTIKFRQSAEGTVTLTSGELSITGELRIDGPEWNRVTVSGGGMSRVFNIASGSTVKIDDLTIANGHVSGANGGGILNTGQLTLYDSVVTGCSVSAGLGSAVASTGNLTMTRSAFTGNSGAVMLNAGGGTAQLDHATISGNTGTAIFNNSGSALTVQNSLLTGNHIGSFGVQAIASSGPVNIFNSTISENTGGDEVLSLFGGDTVDVVIRGSRIVNNHTYFAPLVSETNLRIEDTVFRGNSGGEAGAIAIQAGAVEIVNSTISGNVGAANNSYAAGAIATFGNQLTLVDSTIRDNIGAKTGGIYLGFGYGVLEITNSTISGNKAIPVPGGPYGYARGAGGLVTYSAATINNSTISGNTVVADGLLPNQYSSGAAGGILASYSGVTIDHSTIAFNTVTNASPDLDHVSGGVVGLNGFVTADVSVRNSIVARNTATGWDPDVNGSFASQGHNLIGVLTANATGFVAGDVHGTLAQPLDPGLEPLRWNGGRTRTHALRRHSPAINAGDNADAPPTDQRGRTRIVGGTIDIGAYESNLGGHAGPMADTSVDFAAIEGDQLVVSAIVDLRSRRIPEIRTANDTDEHSGSSRDMPSWFGMVRASKAATSHEPLDWAIASRDFDFDDAVFVGSSN